MIILNNMYTGRYISAWGNLGHEAINLIRADDGKFYIWLNSMGVFPSAKAAAAKDCTVIMVRSINSHMYKVLAYAKNCKLCDGAIISRKAKNSGTEDKVQRYNAQISMHVTYNGRCPIHSIYKEEDMFATFYTDEVLEADGDVYLTDDVALADGVKIFYVTDSFRISEAMRAYVDAGHPAEASLTALIDKVRWRRIAANSPGSISPPEFNFFKLIRKERDELSLSNALAHFIGKVGMLQFLDKCLSLEGQLLRDEYKMFRERNNIDISFFGEKNVIIIENKIDASITYNGKSTLNSQIEQAVNRYHNPTHGTKEDYARIIRDIIRPHSGDISQLSKYYIYAVAYLLAKGVGQDEVTDRIKCFLLVPKYSKIFKSDKNGCLDSPLLLAKEYKLITYENILKYFETLTVTDPYYDDFKSALRPLASEFNNELEQDMKYRFFKAIGLI